MASQRPAKTSETPCSMTNTHLEIYIYILEGILFPFQTEEPDSSVNLDPSPSQLLNLTRCPICQKYVVDLPQHISLTHHQPNGAEDNAEKASAINLVKKENSAAAAASAAEGGAPINLSVRCDMNFVMVKCWLSCHVVSHDSNEARVDMWVFPMRSTNGF
jgi:hypothetical protein